MKLNEAHVCSRSDRLTTCALCATIRLPSPHQLHHSMNSTGYAYCSVTQTKNVYAAVDACSVVVGWGGQCGLREDQDGRTGVQPSPEGVVEVLGSLVKKEVAVSWVPSTVVLCDLKQANTELAISEMFELAL